LTSFSERQGFKPIRNALQVDGMDYELRGRLWNALIMSYWDEVKSNAYGQRHLSLSENQGMKALIRRIWHSYFKRPFDTLSNGWPDTYEKIKDYFFNSKWNEAYDFVEFVANNYSDELTNKLFMRTCNDILKQELSGYRFIGGKIAPITSEEEIAEIEKALEPADSPKPVTSHLETALDLFANRESPDYRNSIKESISAVEAICRLITGSTKATLSDALDQIEKTSEVKLHPALKGSFKQLYGYTSDAEGIRHALLEEPHLDFEDAMFMLVSCSAFINYLKVKSSKAGIKL